MNRLRRTTRKERRKRSQPSSPSMNLNTVTVCFSSLPSPLLSLLNSLVPLLYSLLSSISSLVDTAMRRERRGANHHPGLSISSLSLLSLFYISFIYLHSLVKLRRSTLTLDSALLYIYLPFLSPLLLFTSPLLYSTPQGDRIVRPLFCFPFSPPPSPITPLSPSLPPLSSNQNITDSSGIHNINILKHSNNSSATSSMTNLPSTSLTSPPPSSSSPSSPKLRRNKSRCLVM